MGTLIFVDTNIYLDFYRIRGGDKDLSILTKLESHLDSLITTYQVEMEFKKNRQEEIIKTYKNLPGKVQNQQFPAFLNTSKQAAALRKNEQAIQQLARTLQKRVEKILTSPTTSDLVYKHTQRIFKSSSPWNLSRDKKVRYEIWNLARKRFVLGYPPRKDSDTSIGDAINWEWVVRCAKDSGKHVVIVTRDSDFGQLFNEKPIINDWLKQEFKERVSKRREVYVTNRLSEAMRRANISVTTAEATQEEKLIRERAAAASVVTFEPLEGSMPPASITNLKKYLDSLYQTYTTGAEEGMGQNLRGFGNLSDEEELVLGHLYYEQKQPLNELVKHTGLSETIVNEVVANLPHIIKQDGKSLLAARVINRNKSRELALRASEIRNTQE